MGRTFKEPVQLVGGRGFDKKLLKEAVERAETLLEKRFFQDALQMSLDRRG